MNQIEPLLQLVSSTLTPIKGIAGIVLGGSRARGTHTKRRDVLFASLFSCILRSKMNVPLLRNIGSRGLMKLRERVRSLSVSIYLSSWRLNLPLDGRSLLTPGISAAHLLSLFPELCQVCSHYCLRFSFLS